MVLVSVTYDLVEVALGGPQKRGSLIHKSELKEYIRTAITDTKPLYRSVYLYGEEAEDFVTAKNTLKDFYGRRSIDNILIDIDKKDNSDDQTQANAKHIVWQLTEEMGLSKETFQCYFSGTGYHIMLTNEVFNFTPDSELPFKVKETMNKLFEDIDPMVYMRTGLYRVAHTINQKTNLYKVPLSYEQIMHYKSEEIINLAKKPLLDYPYTTLLGDGELEEEKVEKVPRVRTLGKVFEPKKVATCIQTMFNNGPQAGNRHHTLMRMVSHYRRSGIPSDATKAALLLWNNNNLNEQEVINLVEYSYNKGYKYGCNDPVMAELCNPKCIYYKRKDYTVGVYTSTEAQKELEDRLSTDFTGRSYDFAKALGLTNMDCTFYPGELVTIFGPTGCCKTSLAHNIALGYNHYTDEIDSKSQVSTLYLSLELSAWYMQRRSLQITASCTKEYATNNRAELFSQYNKRLEHMHIMTIPPTIEQISKKITELQPAMVIVDYIDLVETHPMYRGEYEKVKHVAHSLSSLAVTTDTIIIQISQVSREYSRSQILDLYAGKGSGAIENASRKVIGLNGQADSKEKSLELLKNTDGELLKAKLEWQPSFRLRRTE
jgi:energy-coupling factor transporter ATP-binding protein EcfA2